MIYLDADPNANTCAQYPLSTNSDWFRLTSATLPPIIWWACHCFLRRRFQDRLLFRFRNSLTFFHILIHNFMRHYEVWRWENMKHLGHYRFKFLNSKNQLIITALLVSLLPWACPLYRGCLTLRYLHINTVIMHTWKSEVSKPL